MSLLDQIIDAIIKFFGGRDKTPEEMTVILDEAAEAHKKATREKLDWRTSVVDLLKLTGQDSSLAYREKLAKELGFKGLLDSASMNRWLHGKVMQQLAHRLGRAPWWGS